MARRGGPALYELLRKSPLPGGTPAKSSPPVELRAPAAASGSFGARRSSNSSSSFQISALWAGVIALAVIAAIATAYSLGARGNGKPTEPLVGGGAPVVPPEMANNPAKPLNPVPTSSLAGASRTGVNADNTSDPRVKGYKYYVLAHPSSTRASELVEFCRLNGLDAYLVPDDNAMLRKVIVLPGYRDSSEKNSETIRKLESEVRRVGEKWKTSGRAAGNKDFSDAYPEMFR